MEDQIALSIEIRSLAFQLVFIGNILVVGDEAGGIEDDMVVDVIFINVGTDHIFIFSTLHPQIVVPDDVRFRHQFLQA